MTRWDKVRVAKQIGGVFLCTFGLCFLPLGYHLNPKGSLTTAGFVADAGVFMKEGLALLGLGVLVVAASSLVPRR